MPIDINCDLGEYHNGVPDLEHTEQLMQYITSCNIACGFHSGDARTIYKTIELAKKYKVKIGAHPSYQDRKNFGRKSMKLSTEELNAILIYQIGAVEKIATTLGTSLHHVKPHGALYHDLCTNKELAFTFVKSIEAIDSNLVIYGKENSQLETMASFMNIGFKAEGFADRVYTKDLTLQNRMIEGAVINDANKALSQFLSMYRDQQVVCEDKVSRTLKVQTICVHGDTKSAIDILKLIHQHLNESI